MGIISKLFKKKDEVQVEKKPSIIKRVSSRLNPPPPPRKDFGAISPSRRANREQAYIDRISNSINRRSRF